MRDALPLTLFEELMLHQDCGAYPACFFVPLTFDGRLRQDSLERAVRIALKRHRLLNALVRDSTRGLHWELLDAPESSLVRMKTDGVANVAESKHLDVRSEPGLRVTMDVADDQTRVLMQFHHSACDGLAAMQFIHDMLIAYADDSSASSRIKLPHVDQDVLAKRGSLGLNAARMVKIAPQQAVGLLGVRQFLMRRPRPLLPHQPAERDDDPPKVYPSLGEYHFSELESLEVRARAKRFGVTLNDLLARDLFLALHEFQRRYQFADEQWLRLMIPINMRSKQHVGSPAANIVSSVFLDRRAGQMTDRASLLGTVKAEMDQIKRLQLGMTFLFSLRVSRWLPGGLQAAAQVPRCRTTAVLTNPGKLWCDSPLATEHGYLRCGDVTLRRAGLAAPIAPHMCAAFGVTWYANQLGITLHYDPRPLGPNAAEDLLAFYVQRVRESADIDPQSNFTSPVLDRGRLSFQRAP